MPKAHLRADYDSKLTQRKGGLRTPYVLADPPFVHRNGPDVSLQKMFTLRRGDAAARAVIGPLAKARRRTKPSSRLRRSVCVALALRRRGTIVSPFSVALHFSM